MNQSRSRFPYKHLCVYHAAAPKAPNPPMLAVGPQSPSATTLPEGPAITTGAVGGPFTAAPSPVAAMEPPPAVIAATPVATGAATATGAAKPMVAIDGPMMEAGRAIVTAALGGMMRAPPQHPGARRLGAAEAAAAHARTVII